MNTETIGFEFKNSKLYIVINDEPMSFTDFSHGLWNDCVLTNNKAGGNVNDVQIEYEKVISQTKQYAMPYGLQGIRIIQEITSITTEHLEFLCKMSKKQHKSKDKQGTPISGIFAVRVNPDAMSVVCLVCEIPPLPGKKLLKCSKCLLAYYCGADCQRADWKSHKQNCCK